MMKSTTAVKILLFVLLVLALSLAILIIWQPFRQPDDLQPVVDDTFSNTLNSDKDDDFEQVLQPRQFSFPADHGPHPGFRLEWWYFTGNLHSQSGRKFGYQLTFFRTALAPGDITSQSRWRSNQIYMAHLALTDVRGRRFHAVQRFSRGALNLAGAESSHYHVWLYDWSASAREGRELPIRLQAQQQDFSIDLLLNKGKPLQLQGQQGFSRKGPTPGNASYYYSYTRLSTTGSIRIGKNTFEVTGNSWMDREWSSSALEDGQTGWDWFALQFDDGSELMFYRFRRRDARPDQNSSGALFLADGTKIPLRHADVTIDVERYWRSPHSQVTYPNRWHLSIPSHGLELDIDPLLDDQELNLRYRYWEGAVSVSGLHRGKKISGQGYVELTGYRND